MTNCNGIVVWFTGLSGSGKSTLARAVAERLGELGSIAKVVDGDDLRKSLSAGLGFGRRDREESARRATSLAQELSIRADFVLVALIAPYRSIRAEIARTLPRYLEIFVNAPLSICEARDPKGLYSGARAGSIRNFTGLDDPYEPPKEPALECQTDKESIQESVQKVLNLLTACVWRSQVAGLGPRNGCGYSENGATMDVSFEQNRDDVAERCEIEMAAGPDGGDVHCDPRFHGHALQMDSICASQPEDDR